MTGQLWPDPTWAYTILSRSSTSMIWVPSESTRTCPGMEVNPNLVATKKILLMSKMIRAVWISSCPSAGYKESPGPEVKQDSRYLVRTVRFGTAFTPRKKLPQKSLLLPSLVWTEQSSLTTFPEKLCCILKHQIQELKSHRVSSATLNI